MDGPEMNELIHFALAAPEVAKPFRKSERLCPGVECRNEVCPICLEGPTDDETGERKKRRVCSGCRNWVCRTCSVRSNLYCPLRCGNL